jgi:8-oxo-dGTP pyrophosphatase MutT (NUDIX family)
MTKDFYKIFIINNLVIIGNKSIKPKNAISISADNINDKNAYSKLKSLIKLNLNKVFFIEGGKSEIAKFESLFQIRKAGGGIVFNEDGDILLIKRNGVWDLPKGHLEKGESMQECAIREVQEETGLKEIELKNLVDISRHIYKLKGNPVIKESHWYLMEAKKPSQFTPQTEEGIEKVIWVNPKDLPEYYENMWQSIIFLLESNITHILNARN